MYFGTQEIETVDNNTVTFKNGSSIEITNKNKELFTEEPMTGSDIQMESAKAIMKSMIEAATLHNPRLVDMNLALNLLQETLANKNDEALVKAFGKDKLDTLASIYGASEKLASISVRSIRLNDIFNS